jgi:hypothetical protein
LVHDRPRLDRALALRGNHDQDHDDIVRRAAGANARGYVHCHVSSGPGSFDSAVFRRALSGPAILVAPGEPVSGIEPLTCRLQDGCSAY